MQFENREDCIRCVSRVCDTYGADGLAAEITQFGRDCEQAEVLHRIAADRLEECLQTARDLARIAEVLERGWDGFLAAQDARRYTRTAGQYAIVDRESSGLLEGSRTLVDQMEAFLKQVEGDEFEDRRGRFQGLVESAREGAQTLAEFRGHLPSAMVGTFQEISESIEETSGGRIFEAILSRPAGHARGALALAPAAASFSPGRTSVEAAVKYGSLLGLNKVVLLPSEGKPSAMTAGKIVGALDARTVKEKVDGRTVYRIDPTAHALVPKDRLHATGGQLSWYKEIHGRTEILRRYLEQLVCHRCCCHDDNLLTIKDSMEEIFEDIVREVGQPERPCRVRLIASLESLDGLGAQLETELAGHSGAFRPDELEIGESERELRHLDRLHAGVEELGQVVLAMLDDLESAKGPKLMQLLRVNEAIPDKVQNVLAQMDAAGLVEGQRRAFRVSIPPQGEAVVWIRENEDTTIEDGLQWVSAAAQNDAGKLGKGDLFQFEARTMEKLALGQKTFVHNLLELLPNFIPQGLSYVEIALKDLQLAVNEKHDLAGDIASDVIIVDGDDGDDDGGGDVDDGDEPCGDDGDDVGGVALPAKRGRHRPRGRWKWRRRRQRKAAGAKRGKPPVRHSGDEKTGGQV